MLMLRRKIRLESERLVLRPPIHADFGQWSALREESRSFLTQWEPIWSHDHLTRRAFTNRVYWAARSITAGTALPLFLLNHDEDQLMGAITLDNIRRGPAQAGTLGYWIGERYARQGYMSEALNTIVEHAFDSMAISRLEAACLPENEASRGLLERAGFKYEGVAQSYLQINGRWRTHVLYASLRLDRRGKAPTA